MRRKRRLAQIALALALALAVAPWGCRVSGRPDVLDPIRPVDPSARAATVGSGAAAAPDRPLTLVTWNVHSLIGTDDRYDPKRVAAVIRETGADVVALQELGDFRGSIPRGAPEELARELDLPLVFCATVETEDGRRFGNAVLTRLPVLAAWTYDLTARPLEPRRALRVDLELPGGGRLAFVCVHLGLVPLERGAQVAALGERVLSGISGPALACGDFNHWAFGRDRAIERGGFTDVARALGGKEATFPAGGPFLRLDRVYANRLVRPLEIRVHRSALAERASDHLPLVCRFVLRLGVAEPAPSGAEGRPLAQDERGR